MVFQNYSLFPHMSVGENVAFGPKMRRVGTAEKTHRVRAMLQMVRLEQMEDQQIHQLSGGQQQRIALARALATEPSILLLDEPLGALDKDLREGMQFELRDIQRKLGITSILVTHDQEEALTMSDRVAVMAQGEVVEPWRDTARRTGAADVQRGYVSVAAAEAAYGVVIRDGAQDAPATQALRAARRRSDAPPHFAFGPERDAHDLIWNADAYAVLTKLLAALPVHWSFFVKTKMFEAMAAKVQDVPSVFASVRESYPEIPEIRL